MLKNYQYSYKFLKINRILLSCKMKNSRFLKNYCSGFTLIELMVVVSIAAILAAIAIPSYQMYITKQKISAAQADLTALALNLDGHLLNNTVYPAANESTANTAGVRQVLPGWVPVQAADFDYSLVAVNNTAFPPSYKVQAKGTSAKVKDCVVQLSSDGTRTKQGCPGGDSNW